ncbi:branched-chain amino acid transport system II carrier protein, partial [Enterococcus faecium]
IVQNLLYVAESYLPFFKLGMGWIVPAVIGFVIGLIWSFAKKEEVAD